MSEAGPHRGGVRLVAVLDASQAEVGQTRLAVDIEQHVLWLHVPVQDASPMGGIECAGNGDRHGTGALPRERALVRNSAV